MMMRLGMMAWALVAAAPGGAAGAADKLAIAPPAAWVKPVALPADDGKGDAPVKLLLRDEQDDLEPGRTTRFNESVFRIATPQGLSAGGVTITWNPEFETATVHKLQIRRGAQVIDVLATQSFTVVRRETNLENAMIDGVLTGTIQPEGLQVGDVIDFSASITTSDPALGNHLENAGATWNGLPFGRAHLRLQWPHDVAMRFQPVGDLPVPKVTRAGDLSTAEITLDALKPMVPPKGAPMRFQLGRLLEATDFASWRDLVALQAPLYAKAEALGPASPLRAEIARIAAASPDPKARAEAALALVQDRVRYVFIGLNDGGLVPAAADTTWSRRFGDCKGKTVLLLALLHGLGIDAAPVLVSTVFGDGLDQRLPEIALFNHVLVRATIAGRTYWLDGTRVGDRTLDGIQTLDFHWGLPLVPGTGALVAMTPAPLDRPQTEVVIRIDARKSLTQRAPVHIERTVRGDEAVATNLALASLVGDARDNGLRQFWRQRYDFADPAQVSASFDPVARTMTLVLDGTTKMDWHSGWYEADHVWVGYKPDFARDPGADKSAPYAVPYPTWNHVTETILLPADAKGWTITDGADVDTTVAGIAYHRQASVADGRFTVEESDRSVAPEFPAAAAPAAAETLRALADKGVFLNAPKNYAGTTIDIDARIAAAPATVSGLVEQGQLLGVRERYAESLAKFDQVLAQQSKNIDGLHGRGSALLNLGRPADARKTIDVALAIAPDDLVEVRQRGLSSELLGQRDAALADYSRVLAAQPDDLFALEARARVHADRGELTPAEVDLRRLIELAPDRVDSYRLLANLRQRQGDLPGVAQAADLLLARDGDSTLAMVTAGKIYAAAGRREAAVRQIDAAIARAPEPYMFLNLASVRPAADRAAALADLDAGLRLDPKDAGLLGRKAELQGAAGDWPAALATLNTGLVAAPGDGHLLGLRGIVQAKLGRAVAAADFDAARKLASTPEALNDLCWSKATANVALDRALAECDAALAGNPDQPSYLDSRALVLLRLGRRQDAVQVYGHVLARTPNLVSSLYGRALAEAQAGDRAAAERDAAAAIRLEPDVAADFAGYGFAPIAPPPAQRTASAAPVSPPPAAR